jgi:hypothetical protein
MTALQLRKQILLLESDLNRLRLHAECERLREAVGWVSRIKEARGQIAPWALLLAPPASVALALRLRRSASCGGFLSQAIELAHALIRLWRTCVWPSNQSEMNNRPKGLAPGPQPKDQLCQN